MKQWFSAAELAGLPGLPGTVRGITKMSTRDGWKSRPRTARGGGREYSIASLPEPARLHLAAAALTASAPAREGAGVGRRLLLEERIEGRVELQQRRQGMAQTPQLQDRAVERMDARLVVLSMVDNFAARAGLKLAPAIEAFVDLYNQRGMEIDAGVLEAMPEISAGSIYRWRKRLQTEGAAALAGRYGNRSGATKIDQVAEIRDLVLGILKEHPHAGAKHILRAIRARYQADLLPSLRALQRWVKRWKAQNKQLHLAVTNPDAWRSRYRAAGGDADEHIHAPNQLWELDSTPADVMLADGQRHAIIGVIDVYTRRMKLHVSHTSKATAIAALVRRTMLDWGVPEAARTDEGSDYTSKHMMRVFMGLGIRHIICPPFSPERKPFIERALGTFSHDLVELLGGFVGHNVAERKAIESRRSFADRLMKRGDEQLELRMTAEELQEFCDNWTDTIYAHDAHSGLNGKTPFEMSTAERWTIKSITDERSLDVLLSEVAGGDGWRHITKKGIRVDRGYYDDPQLGGLEGSRVRVLLDDYDYGHVYVFSEAGEFICKAADPGRTGISRSEVAAKRRAVQQQVISAGKKELKDIARRARTQDVVQDILKDRAEAAGKLARLPAPTVEHTTPVMEQARRAAGLSTTPEPRELTPEEQQIHDELVARHNAPAQVIALEETPDARYRRAVRLERVVAAGGAVSEKESTWLKGYQTTAEYKGSRDMHQMFGLDPLAEEA